MIFYASVMSRKNNEGVNEVKYVLILIFVQNFVYNSSFTMLDSKIILAQGLVGKSFWKLHFLTF